MSYKIVLVGGGSYNWTCTIATDLFLQDSLDGSELMLMDINPVCLEELHRYCEFINNKLETHWSVSSSTDLDLALDSADTVILTIGFGGLEAMQLDWDIPEKYGILHTVADTIGPGGISRALRHVPVAVNIARKMERLCPKAWFINITNPMTQVVEAVNKASSIKCIGLCHEFEGTLSYVSKMLKIPQHEIQADAIGTNHCTFATRIEHNGRDLLPELTMEHYLEFAAKHEAKLKTGTTDDLIKTQTDDRRTMERYVNIMFRERFGYLPMSGAPHIVENFPFFVLDQEKIISYRIRRKGVLPFRKEALNRNRDRLLKQMSGEEKPELTRSNEQVSDIVAGVCTGKEGRSIVNAPNAGLVPDLPKNAVLEGWGNYGKNGIQLESVEDVPTALVGLLMPAIISKTLTAEAAIEGSIEKLRQAFLIDPMIVDVDIIDPLINDLLAAHKEYLPQFNI